MDAVEVYGIADRSQTPCQPVGHIVEVDERSQDDSAAICCYLFVVLEKLFLDVSVLGLFGSERVHETDDNQLKPLEPSELGQIALEFLQLKFIISEGQVTSDQEGVRVCILVDHPETTREEITVRSHN